ncbi:MipA/OmpV family protein [Azoarcus indigens]|uniref:Outer membrane scaffolding protein for murein synthesis (MipA/OmpV family) n=1 Tax=Azoarcus indigens TaxID=29545 RepID=A0A4R6DS03_9RHOO|nr:MipA/OmpV family protein [Azoarcus indigens]NMG66611.1 MipA/OmpV family protein [Azoarcus indigens]TDN47088.1 outer membrane scaffolding protein for murein synthesis (MipA/OmpV family) [Azoarcus indigens]
MSSSARRFSRLLLTALGVATAGAAAAAERPLWELGLGVGAVSFPDYRGADERSTYVLPAPYVVYRGEFLKADRDGVRGVFFESDRVELNFSAAASVPVDSDGNKARRGMPDLKPTVEFGPSLDLTLWRAPDRSAKLDFRLPVRAAYAVIGGVKRVGLVSTPTLNLDLRDPLGQHGWNLGLLAGPVFGDARQHRYFYDVAPEHATPGRETYRAKGGYGGSQFLAALSKRYDNYWVGAFVRYDNLRGAVFDDSPLVKRDQSWAAGFAIAWIIGESATRVQVND